MPSDSKILLTSADVLAAARLARLNLGDDRADVVAPALDGILQSFDLLDAVDLGETPPTNSFDPRWRKL
ncbi:MAG: Asp-tRNA(Asn)/Glu-tRNA(Gln) amidotransferase subunit GatC [Pseudomonadota bacterium]